MEICPICGRAIRFGICRGCGREWLCEQRPYPGAGYHCLLPAGHWGRKHSDLTIEWE